jgi:hypothetical protein
MTRTVQQFLPRNTKQIQNFRQSVMIESRISSYDIASITSLQQHHHIKFIRRVITSPDLMIFVGIDQAFDLANRCFSHSRTQNSNKQLLTYDTTFNIGGYYMSTLGSINPELKETPFYPICFMIHDRKLTETHQMFLEWAFNKLSINGNIPIVTDREDAIRKFFKNNKLLDSLHVFCHRHICTDVKLYMNGKEDNQTAMNLRKDIKKLCQIRLMDEYIDTVSKLKEVWPIFFTSYFEKNIDNDLKKIIQILENKQFPVFEGKLVTTNSIESFHSGFKRMFNKDELNRPDKACFCAMIYQLHRLRDFERAIAFDGLLPTGPYNFLPQFRHLVKPLDLPNDLLDLK